MRLRQTDVHGNVLTIPLSKSGRERHVPLNIEAQAILGRTPSIGAYVFSTPRGGKLDSGTFAKRVFLPAVRGAGLEDFRWHDLRHTFASRLVMAGVPLYTVSKLLGHHSVKMTERYAHLAPGLLHDAVAVLTAVRPPSPGVDGPQPSGLDVGSPA